MAFSFQFKIIVTAIIKIFLITIKEHAYVISSVLKLETIVLIKLSRMMTARIDFQSLAFSPNNKQIDSRATLTIAGGFAIERTSTRCCFFIDFTARCKRIDKKKISVNEI